MALSALPVAEVESLVSSAEFSMSAHALVGAPEPYVSPKAAEIGNVHTFSHSSYFAQDQAKLDALTHVRLFFTFGALPVDRGVAHWVRWLAHQLIFDPFSGTIWKEERTLRLKVLETPADILAVMKELHDGFGHRALPAVYHHFRLQYWIPPAAEVIKQYIEGCSACQQLAAPNKFEVPGYQV